MSGLEGVRVVLLEARMSGELAKLVEKQGGQAVSVPAVREEGVEGGAELAQVISRLIDRDPGVVIFQTGVGADRLFEQAERLGKREALLAALKQGTLVARGPKPVAALRKAGLSAAITVPEPYTTGDLLTSLAPLDLSARSVILLHYGERNEPLATALRERASHLEELYLYVWRLPEDLRPLEELVGQLAAGEFEALAVTNQVQVRHLFEVASRHSLTAQVTAALRDRIVVASVGPTTTAVLESFGIQPKVVPEHPKMGPMVTALARYFSSTKS